MEEMQSRHTQQSQTALVNGRIKSLVMIVIIGILLKVLVPVVQAGEENQVEAAAIVAQVRTITPLSIEMVDKAMVVLAKGWSGMSPDEQEAFINLYDPAGTGDIDEAFVQQVLSNYQKIRDALGKDINIKSAAGSEMCEGQRLYYTDILNIHVCPYFLSETDDTRKARTLVHEMSHIALKVKDRPYYRPTSKAYAELTPKGSWLTELPVIGPVIREVVASDTLYHPDTYAHFALAMSGLEGTLNKYLDHDVDGTHMSQNGAAQEDWPDTQVTDAWLHAR
jgi:hypothetical protein